MTTPEYRTMVRCTVSLTDTLANDIENIGDVFFAKGFIARGVHDTTKSLIKEPKEKSRVLVSVLTNKVKTSSECFHTIVLVLMKQEDWINGLIEELRTTYIKYGGKNFPVIGQKSVPSISPSHSGAGSRENNSYRNGANNRKKPQKTSPPKDREGRSRHSKFSDNRGGIFKPDPNRRIWYCAGFLTCLLIMTTLFILPLIGYMFFCVWSTNAICPGNQIISNNAVPPNEGTGICQPIATKEDRKLVHKTLGEVGDWSKLCLYLDVNRETRKALKYDTIQVQQKITQCVDAYLEDKVPPCFETVVKVLCDLHQSKLASELAAKKGMDYQTVCKP